MSSERPRFKFLALPLGLCALVGFFVVTSADGVGDEVETQVRTARWMAEIRQSAAEQTCAVVDAKFAQQAVEQTVQSLSIWHERERVDSGQALRSWRSIEVALKCVALAQSFEGGELLASAKTLEQERERLIAHFSSHLRSWHAAYVRGSAAGQNEEVVRALRGILMLIAAHPGKLKSDLARHFRQIETKEPPS